MTEAGLKATRWQQLLWQLARTLRRWPWFDTLRTLRLRFREDKLALTASSLTFTTLIALVPLVTVTLAVFTAFPIFGNFQAALEKYLLQSLVPDNIAHPVLQALTQFASKASRLGSAGLIALGVTALALMLTIDHKLNAIWRVPRPRPMAQRVLVYWAALTLGPLLLGASLTLTSYAISASRGLVGDMPGSLSVLLWLLQTALLAAGNAALFRYVPNTHVRWRHAWAGGLFVALAFEVAKRALTWYVTAMPAYSMVYGAFATVPILLLWVYLGWIIVLLGAVIAAYAPSIAMHVVRLPDRPGQRFGLALEVLRALARARAEQSGGLTLFALAEQLHVDPLQVEPVVEALRELDWCARLDEAGEQRHVLLVDPERTPAAPLVDRMLLEPDSATLPFRRRAGLDAIRLAELL
jgi:membrane protein